MKLLTTTGTTGELYIPKPWRLGYVTITIDGTWIPAPDKINVSLNYITFDPGPPSQFDFHTIWRVDFPPGANFYQHKFAADDIRGVPDDVQLLAFKLNGTGGVNITLSVEHI